MNGKTKVFKNANLDVIQADWTRTAGSNAPNSAVSIVRYPDALIVRTNGGNTLVFTPKKTAARCDCENLACKVDHPLAGCKNESTVKTTHSRICEPCAEYMPPQYLDRGAA